MPRMHCIKDEDESWAIKTFLSFISQKKEVKLKPSRHDDMEEELSITSKRIQVNIRAKHPPTETMGDEPQNSSDAQPPQAPVSFLSPALQRLLTVSAGIEDCRNGGTARNIRVAQEITHARCMYYVSCFAAFWHSAFSHLCTGFHAMSDD